MSTDTNKHTPAFKLFHYPFQCQVPAIHVRTKEYNELYGSISTGNPERDRALLNEPMDIIATVRQMAEYHQNGVEIILTNPEDSVRIYQIIIDFLNSYDAALSNNYSMQVKDKEFFRNLDSLAAEVYKIARRYMKDAPATGVEAMLREINSRGPLSRELPEPVEVQKEHKPISDSISLKSLQREKLWR